MKHEESDIQKQIVRYLRQQNIFCHSVPNEAVGKISTRGGLARVSNLKAMGLTPGIADLVVWLAGKACYVEVKTATGKLSANQKTFKRMCESCNILYFVVRSLDEVVSIVENTV